MPHQPLPRVIRFAAFGVEHDVIASVPDWQGLLADLAANAGQGRLVCLCVGVLLVSVQLEGHGGLVGDESEGVDGFSEFGGELEEMTAAGLGPVEAEGPIHWSSWKARNRWLARDGQD